MMADSQRKTEYYDDTMVLEPHPQCKKCQWFDPRIETLHKYGFPKKCIKGFIYWLQHSAFYLYKKTDHCDGFKQKKNL
ncbi:MAG: hypothetical protein ACFFDT_00180 [Candidatus Hodarchaeota archaeon]